MKPFTNCKAHRATLIQPVVHLRRPDMQGWDGWLHVNPFGFGASGDTGSSVVEVGAAVVFNPTEQTLEFVLVLPLYYCGLDVDALVTVNGDPPVTMTLNRDYTVHLTMSMPAQSITTIVVARP